MKDHPLIIILIDVLNFVSKIDALSPENKRIACYSIIAILFYGFILGILFMVILSKFIP